MTPQIKTGIRARLLLLLLLLTLPFLLHVGISYLREAQSDRREAAERMLTAARVTAARLDDHVGDIRQLLKVLAHVAGGEAADLDANNRLLRSLVDALPPHINDISVWNARGDNVGSLNPLSDVRLRNIRQLPAFKAAMLGRELSVDAPLKSTINGAQIALFSVPITSADVVVGVVTASTRLDRLQELLAPKSSLPPGAVLTVSDDRGILLARSVDADTWIGTDQSRQSYFKTALGQREGTAEAPDADGVVRTAGFTTSQRLPWLVYAAAPSDQLLTELQHRTEYNLLLGFVMLLIGAMAAVRVGNKIAWPLRQLCSDASTIGAGDFTHRSRVKDSGEVGLLAATLNQMTAALQDRTELLERSQDQLKQITDNVPALVSYLDTEQRFVFANRAYRDWFNVDPQDLIGRSLQEYYGAAYDRFGHYLRQALTGERVVYEREIETVLGSRYVQVTAVPQFGADGQVRGLNVLMHDITQRKISEDQLRQRAEFDLLTGLPNRGLFHDRLKQGMAAAAESGRPMALLLLDVDYFKLVNDRHGHAAGDDLLRAFSRRLLDNVRPTDTVARLSGDEFAVLLIDVDGMASAARVADKLVHAIRVPMTIRDTEIAVTTSVGVALCLPGDVDGVRLMGRADAALYDAKGRGRDGYSCEAMADPDTAGL